MKPSRIRIALSDPWDLGESLNWKPLTGELVRINFEPQGDRALVRFDVPLDYGGVSYGFAVVAPRHKGGDLRALLEGGKVFCSFIAVSDEHARSANALSTEHWRGGLSFIGDIQDAASHEEYPPP
jgi:hypothetical protein